MLQTLSGRTPKPPERYAEKRKKAKKAEKGQGGDKTSPNKSGSESSTKTSNSPTSTKVSTTSPLSGSTKTKIVSITSDRMFSSDESSSEASEEEEEPETILEPSKPKKTFMTVKLIGKHSCEILLGYFKKKLVNLTKYLYEQQK